MTGTTSRRVHVLELERKVQGLCDRVLAWKLKEKASWYKDIPLIDRNEHEDEDSVNVLPRVRIPSSSDTMTSTGTVDDSNAENRYSTNPQPIRSIGSSGR